MSNEQEQKQQTDDKLKQQKRQDDRQKDGLTDTELENVSGGRMPLKPKDLS